jgi:hypothetical protein
LGRSSVLISCQGLCLASKWETVCLAACSSLQGALAKGLASQQELLVSLLNAYIIILTVYLLLALKPKLLYPRNENKYMTDGKRHTVHQDKAKDYIYISGTIQ